LFVYNRKITTGLRVGGRHRECHRRNILKEDSTERMTTSRPARILVLFLEPRKLSKILAVLGKLDAPDDALQRSNPGLTIFFHGAHLPLHLVFVFTVPPQECVFVEENDFYFILFEKKTEGKELWKVCERNRDAAAPSARREQEGHCTALQLRLAEQAMGARLVQNGANFHNASQSAAGGFDSFAVLANVRKWGADW
jgi:hypothetical protein